MKTFKEYIQLSEKITGTKKPYEKLLYETYLNFLNDYFNTSLRIDLSLKKSSFWMD